MDGRGDLYTCALLAVRPEFDIYTHQISTSDLPLRVNQRWTDKQEKQTWLLSLSEIYQQLRYLTAQKALSDFTCLNKADMLAFQRTRSSIEYSLLCLSPIATRPESLVPPRTAECPVMTYVFEAHRVAALLYLYSLCVDCEANSDLINELRNQLTAAIQVSEDLSPQLMSRHKTSLWIYFLGGALALDDKEETWFAEKAVDVMISADINDWDETENMLKETLWAEALKAKIWRSLWNKVQEIKKMRMQHQSLRVGGKETSEAEMGQRKMDDAGTTFAGCCW